MRNLIVCILLLLPCTTIAQEADRKVRLNAGFKIGFQAITYNDPSFEIDGYEYNENTIQSNKIGYILAPYLRLSKGSIYLQAETAFGITRHSFDFTDVRQSNITNVNPNTPIYNLTTYCLQVPIVIGYEFIKQNKYCMSVFAGPRTKFIFTAHDKQEFKHFSYDDLEDELEKKAYFIEVGLGVRIYNVIFDIVYDLGLTDASKYISAPKMGKQFKAERRNNILSFSVGMIF